MKSVFFKSEVAFSKKTQSVARDYNPCLSTLQVISHDMQSHDLHRVIEAAVRCYMEAKEKMTEFISEEQFYMIVAQSICEKLDADSINSNPWQVILGSDYGSFVTHESFYFVSFKFDQLWFTIYVSC